APANHDARDPEARADPLEDEVARNFEQAVAEKEEAGGQAVRGGIEAERKLEIRGDEADVDAVDVGDHVADEGERNEPALHAREHATAVDGRSWSGGGRGAGACRLHGRESRQYRTAASCGSAATLPATWAGAAVRGCGQTPRPACGARPGVSSARDMSTMREAKWLNPVKTGAIATPTKRCRPPRTTSRNPGGRRGCRRSRRRRGARGGSRSRSGSAATCCCSAC